MAVENDDYLKTWLKIPEDSGAEVIKLLDRKGFVETYWDQKTRPDGRLFSQVRPTQVVSSLLKHAAGSALVKQGETKVLSAMTVQIGQPSPALPDHGDVVVSVTTPDQTTHSDVLQSWLQRMLDDLLPQYLNLMTGKACLRLVVTVMILQDDGNLKDAALLACMAAWKNTTLPTMEELKEVEGKLWWKEEPSLGFDKPVQKDLEQYRVSLSVGVLEKDGKSAFIVDPTRDESPFLAGSATIVVTLPENAVQLEYTGERGLSATDIALAVKLAKGRAEETALLLK